MLLLAKIASPFSLSRTCLTLKGKSKQRTAGYTHAHYSYGKYRIRAQVNDLVFLGIETSCDDTGAAVVTGDGEILSQVISSQADLLAQYGGVVPKMAEEAHAQVIDRVVEQAIQNAKLKPSDLTAVAVTIGPGLSLCLRIGVRKARTIAGKYCLPMVGVHHMEAHALVARLTEKELDFPFLTLLVSGGHNLLILAQNVGQYIQLGTTIDDAIGEAYDKIAKWLGLDMRKGGGPALEELAKEGDQHSITLSVPMQKYKDCNFSYAGLKTQVRRIIEFNKIDAIRVPIISASSEDRKLRANIAASFQRVAVLHLEKMSQIHPHRSPNATEQYHSADACPQTLTVWKKALFFSGTGFMIYDSSGNLLFRVENWTPNVTTQLILMDASGNPLILLRRKVLSLHHRWEGYICNEGDRPKRRRAFSMKCSSIISATTSIDIFVGSSFKEYMRRHADYHIEGSFRERACAIYTRNRSLVAQVKRKHENCSMVVDKGVFSLVIYPGFDHALIASWIVILNHINREYLSNLLLSSLNSTLMSYRFLGKPEMGRKGEGSSVDKSSCKGKISLVAH